MIRIWLDDEIVRRPGTKVSPLADSPEDRWERLVGPVATWDPPKAPAWAWVRSVEQLLDLVRAVGFGRIERISFDSDLGVGYMQGREALDALEEIVAADPTVTLVPDMWAHTRNPEAKRVMLGVIGSIYRLVEARGGVCGTQDDRELEFLRRQCLRCAAGWDGKV